MVRRSVGVVLLGLVAALGAASAVAFMPSTAQGTAGTLMEHRAASCRTDTEGTCSVTHKLGTVPTTVEVSPRSQKGKKPYDLSVVTGSETATLFSIRAVSHHGRPKADRIIRFFYWAYGDPTPKDTPAPTTTVPTTSPSPTTTSAPPTTAPRTAAPSTTTTTTTATTSSADTPAAVCGSAELKGGPATAPEGAVAVPAGNNAGVDFGRANTTYWFAAGVHTLGSGQYDQISPGDHSTFIGAPEAVLDGQGINRYAFTQHGAGVTIKHLTIRGFAPPMNEGVVNHDSGNGWLVENNTLTLNKGAALMAGDDNVIRGNCLKDNGQYGLNAYQAGDGPTNLLLEGNEFTGNNTEDWESQIPGCGCTGAMKFWSVDKADVRNNWIHHNHGAGIWADNNNNDFLIEGNYIEANDAQGIFYEQSYNGVIRNNTLRDNTWKLGRSFSDRGDGFSIGTIYVSEAGGDARIPARNSTLEITGNLLENNWGGIALWENADRFCNSPNNTGSDCTLPMGGDQSRVGECSQPGIANEPLYGDCRWKTQDVDIHHNEFVVDPALVDGGCDPAFCATSAVFSNYGTSPDWSPYQRRAIQEAITFKQDNRWHDNSYVGPWRFVAYEPCRHLTLAQWKAAPYHQDAGSS